MKKIISILAILLTVATSFSFAQTGTRSGPLKTITPQGTVNDTTFNADTVYLWNGSTSNNQWDVSYEFVCTQLTGTTTPTMIVQGSNDATSITTGHWYTLTNSSTQFASPVNTFTSLATTYLFNIPHCQFRYVRVQNITSGTQTSITTGTWWTSAPFNTQLN